MAKASGRTMDEEASIEHLRSMGFKMHALHGMKSPEWWVGYKAMEDDARAVYDGHARPSSDDVEPKQIEHGAVTGATKPRKKTSRRKSAP